MAEQNGSEESSTNTVTLTEKSADGIGVGDVTHFPEPKEDGFGIWHEQVHFPVGCRPLEEIDKGGAVIVATETTLGVAQRRVIELGRTPKDFDPRNGGELLADAGDVGDYLLGEQILLPDGQENPERTFTYLDRADLEDSVFKTGNRMTVLAKNSDRNNRILSLRGKVRSVVARH